ncbi:glycosyltransferase family 39 protein [Aestuariivirga sp.]|uniref:glycosyltransferase family 39 protein n=1 Tax=Aestuariivirga sp. TaxID=2650926 RepID=UPI0039192E05
MMVSSLHFRRENPVDDLDWAFSFMVLGATSLGAALILARGTAAMPALPLPAVNPLNLGRIQWLPAAGGVLLLSLVSEVNGMVLQVEVFNAVPAHLQFTLFASGLALVAWGFGGGLDLRGLTRLRDALWSLEGLCLFLILLLAFLLRTWQLETSVRGLIDETHWVDAIQAVEDRPVLKLFSQMSGLSPYSWLYPYWQTHIGGYFGHNFTGLRITSAFAGTLTVAALWGLARILMDRQAALIGALVLATFPPHVHFSRLALAGIADPVFGTLMLLFMALAIRYNNRNAWALAGVAVGLTQYFYDAGRLFYPALAAAWWLMLAFAEYSAARMMFRTQLRGVLIMAVVALLAAMPFLYTTAAQGKALFGRMGESGLGADYWLGLLADGFGGPEIAQAMRRLSQPFLFYIRLPEIDGNYYGGQQGLVITSLVGVFLLGAFYLVLRWRNPASLFVLWITAAALANGLLVRDSMVATRHIIVLPALAMSIASGVRYILPLIFPNSGTRTGILLRGGLTAGLAAAIGLMQVSYYFGPHLQQFNIQFRAFQPFGDGVDAALRAAKLPPNTQTYLVGTPKHEVHVPRAFLGYLLRNNLHPLVSLSAEEVTVGFLQSLPGDRPYAFFVDINQLQIVDLLRDHFPQLQNARYTESDVPLDEQYVLFFAPQVRLYDGPLDQ